MLGARHREHYLKMQLTVVSSPREPVISNNVVQLVTLATDKQLPSEIVTFIIVLKVRLFCTMNLFIVF